MKKERHCECCGEILSENEVLFCSEECAEIYYCPEPNKPATKRQAIRIATDKNGDVYVAE